MKYWIHQHQASLGYNKRFMNKGFDCEHNKTWVSKLNLELNVMEHEMKLDVFDAEMDKTHFLFDGNEFPIYI